MELLLTEDEFVKYQVALWLQRGYQVEEHSLRVDYRLLVKERELELLEERVSALEARLKS